MISKIEKDEYQKNGFLVLRQFFPSAILSAISEESAQMLERKDIIFPENIRCRWQNHIENGAPILDAVDPVLDLCPSVSSLAFDSRLLEILKYLLNEPVYLFKDKFIFKPPGALGCATHQDYIAWPEFPESFTTVLVAIDPANRENGCLSVYSGYHNMGLFSQNDGDYHDLPESLFDQKTQVNLILEPGDIAIFGCYLPHGSAPNRTQFSRRHLYLSYNRSSDFGDRREEHYRQFYHWLKNRYAEYGCTNFIFK